MNAAGGGPIRLLLVDDRQAVRRGLKMRLALEQDLEVVGEIGDGAGAISLAEELRPDMVLMDIEIPDMSGVEVIETLGSVAPGSAVVVLTLRDDAQTRERALEAGAAAFVAKRHSEEALLAEIREMAGREQNRLEEGG